MLSLLLHDLCHGRSSSRWLPAAIQTAEYYSVLERNELSNHEKTWRRLECILLNKSHLSEKTPHCATLEYVILRKASLRQLKDLWLPQGQGGGVRILTVGNTNLRCPILWRWLHVIYLSKPTGHITPRMDPRENYRHRVVVMGQWGLSHCNGCALWWQVLIMGVGSTCGGGCTENLCNALSILLKTSNCY